MKASVYIETTVVSYLVAEPSKDLIQAAHQQVTHDWWATRSRFDLYISAAVVSEARRGDEIAAACRLEVLNRIPLLAAGSRAGGLVRSLLQRGALPAKARLDAAMSRRSRQWDRLPLDVESSTPRQCRDSREDR